MTQRNHIKSFVAASALALAAGPVWGQDALGTFDREQVVPPGVSDVGLLADGQAVVLGPLLGGGARLESPTESGAPYVAYGHALCVLDDGQIAVADTDAILIFSMDGVVQARIPFPVAGDGRGVDALVQHDDGFLIVESEAHRVRALGPDGAEQLRLAGKGATEGAFLYPSDVAVDSTGRFFVVDRDNHRVQRFSADGTFERAWGGRGAFPGLLAAPSSIDIENDLAYVSEELNHRVSVFDLDGRYRYQWGMHSVVPRQGEGRIHYPMSVDVSADASRAVVAEPFERRIQFFERFPGGIAEARQQPMPSKQDIRSHFGPYIAGEDDLVALWEPETGSIAVFDLAGETGINITVFTNHGDGWDDLGRLGAMHIDAEEQVITLSDIDHDRLMRWVFDRDRDGVLKYDPFMARLASAVDLSYVRSDLEARFPDQEWVTPRIVGFARATGGERPLFALDDANGVVLLLDQDFAPMAVGTSFTGPASLLTDGGAVYLLEDGPAGQRMWSLGAQGEREGAPVAVPIDGPSGGAVVHDGTLFQSERWNDRIAVFEADSNGAQRMRSRTWGQTGDEDGAFYAPAGLAVIGGGRIVVVDQGNHRAQIFAPDGTWLSTFSLSSGYTTPRRKASETSEPSEPGES